MDDKGGITTEMEGQLDGLGGDTNCSGEFSSTSKKVEFTCANCNKSFTRDLSKANRTIRKRMRSYCSRACRKEHVGRELLSCPKRRKPEGSCVSCRNPAREGKIKCQECSDKHNEAQRIRRREKSERGICPSCTSPKMPNKMYCDKHSKYHNEKTQKNNRKTKIELFSKYGGAICRCCGEYRLELLTIDHTNNDGNLHRKKLEEKNGSRGGSALYRDIKNQGYPPGYQVLCFNCNVSKGFYGVCPHERERQEQGLLSPLIQSTGVK